MSSTCCPYSVRLCTINMVIKYREQIKAICNKPINERCFVNMPSSKLFKYCSFITLLRRCNSILLPKYRGCTNYRWLLIPFCRSNFQTLWKYYYGKQYNMLESNLTDETMSRPALLSLYAGFLNKLKQQLGPWLNKIHTILHTMALHVSCSLQRIKMFPLKEIAMICTGQYAFMRQWIKTDSFRPFKWTCSNYLVMALTLCQQDSNL